MALRETTYRVVFAGGVESKADSKSVPTTRLLKLRNAIFAKAVSLTKRAGYTSLGTTVLGSASPYGNTRGLAARGDDLVLFTEGSSYSYVEGAAAWSQIPDGIQSVDQSDEALVKTISNQTGCDYATVSGVALVCWDDSRGGVYYAVTESGGGRVIVAPTQASATGTRPRAVRSASKLLLLWAEAALGQIQVIVVDPAAPHAPSTAAVLTDGLVTTLPNFDAVYVPQDADSATGLEGAAIAWNAVDGIHVGWLTPSGVIGTVGVGFNSPVTITPAAAVAAGPAICAADDWGTSTYWGVTWATAADSYAALCNAAGDDPTLPVQHTFTTALGYSGIDYLTVSIRSYANATYYLDVWAEGRAATARDSVVAHVVVDTDGGAASNGTPLLYRGACLASTAWADTPASDLAQRSYVTLLHSTPLFATYLTVRDDGLCVARTLPGNAGDAPASHQLPRVSETSTDRRYQWCAPYKNKLDALNNDVFTEAGPRLVTLDFAADDAYQTAYLGRALYLGGAVPMVYDGISWVEAQPHYAPDWESGATLHTNSTAGSGGLANGTYSYVFWYEATLATGEIIRGATSKPYSVTVSGSDDRVTLTVPSLRLSAWGRAGGTREQLRVCAARTKDGNAATYYRITSLDPSTAGDPNGYVANTQSADTVEIVDEYSDTTLVTKEPHYTTGDVPSNDPIAPGNAIAEGKGRLFVTSASDPNAIYYSQERAEGYAAEFTPELRLVLPPTGGAVTGIAVMDDAVVVFKANAIYRVTGAGPLPNPSVGGEWSAPALVTSDVGCVDQRTIVTTPVGLMFESSKGLYLLDRSGQASYVGAPVESFNSQPFTRATLLEDATQVRFLTSSGESLLYDYLFGQWSTFTQHAGLDAVLVNGTYHYLRTDGRVFKQAATYADDNLQIPMEIETAWIRLGEARQGFQRIWHAQILGTWQSAHVLRVQWQTDYDVDGNWSQPVEFTATSMGGDNYGDGNYGDGDYGGDSPSPYQWTVHVGAKCQAIRFRFTFAEASGAAGACAELTELLLTGGVMGNRNKLPAGRMG